MFPSKSMLEYMTEMNRLFPKTSENDLLHSSNYGIYSQSPSQSTFFNRSSSSADSTSPESYPDVFMPRSSELFNLRCETPITQSFAIPRKQRAIVGRKILGNTEQMKHINKTADEINFTNAWADELSITPPTIEKYQARNYELFPTEKRTPNKILTGLSPINSMSSQFSFEMPRVTSSPQPVQSFSQRFTPPKISGFSPPFLGASSSKPDELASSKMCTFCRKNGEAPLVYMTHAVKEKIGNQNVVTCPILRSHVCSTCGATGDNAHTITYCPVLRSTNNGKRLQSTTITLKNTRIKSNGRRRY